MGQGRTAKLRVGRAARDWSEEVVMVSFGSRLRRAANKFANRAIVTRSIALSLDRPLITFTFDDFPHSAATVGAEILERHGARGTFYASGSLCGLTAEGIAYYRPEDIGSLRDRGHEIGCHTFAHSRTSAMSRKEIERDMERNRAFLTEIAPGLVLQDFAYPYGDASPTSKLLLQARFSSCRGTLSGINLGRADLGLLKAVAPGEHQLGREQIASVIAEATDRKGWLIFYTHDVADEPSRWGCSPALLDEAVGMARRSGAAILTVREALSVLVGR